MAKAPALPASLGKHLITFAENQENEKWGERDPGWDLGHWGSTQL